MDINTILEYYEKQYADLNRKFISALIENQELIKKNQQYVDKIESLENDIGQLKHMLKHYEEEEQEIKDE